MEHLVRKQLVTSRSLRIPIFISQQNKLARASHQTGLNDRTGKTQGRTASHRTRPKGKGKIRRSIVAERSIALSQFWNKGKKLDKLMPRYRELNTLLKEIYQKFAPQFNAEAIYAYFQNLNEKKTIIADVRSYRSDIETLTDAWQDNFVNLRTNWKDNRRKHIHQSIQGLWL